MITKYRRELWKVVRDNLGPTGELFDAAEVGVAEGNYAMEILDWPTRFRWVYLVDRWEQQRGQSWDGGFPDTWHNKNLANVRGRIAERCHGGRAVLLRGDSELMAARVPFRSLSFCYIDCDHSFEGVSGDISAWWPKMVPGGCNGLPRL